jgi:hypothetical protein
MVTMSNVCPISKLDEGILLRIFEERVDRKGKYL